MGSFGKKSLLTIGTSFIIPRNIYIGKNVFINAQCLLAAEEKITINDNVRIGFRTMIITSNYTLHYDEKKGGRTPYFKPVVIEKNAWIGSNVVILAGVTIGEGSIVGAGAVVTKDIPKFSVAVGVPAKVIKRTK